MNDLARRKLSEIVARHGTAVSEDPKKLRALLNDLCPELKPETHVLVSAAEQRVARELLTASDAVPWEVLAARLARRLHDDLALAEPAARWAVESWGLALGKVAPSAPLRLPPPEPASGGREPPEPERRLGQDAPSGGSRPPLARSDGGTRAPRSAAHPATPGSGLFWRGLTLVLLLGAFATLFWLAHVSRPDVSRGPGLNARPLLVMNTSATAYGVAYSPDGNQIASASGKYNDEASSVVSLWGANTGQLQRSLRGHRGEILCVAYSPDGKYLASGANNGDVWLWDAETGQGKRLQKPAETLDGHTQYVHGVAFSPDSKRLASAGQLSDFEGRALSGEVVLWDTASGNMVTRMKGHRYNARAVAFSPVGLWLASGGGANDNKVILWNARTGKQLRTFSGHSSLVTCVAFSRDAARLFSGSGDRTLKVWDPRDGREMLSITGHEGEVSCLAVHPDGKRLVSGCGSFSPGEVIVWDLATGAKLRSLIPTNGDPGAVNSLAISPDGKRVALAHGTFDPGKVTVWSLE